MKTISSVDLGVPHYAIDMHELSPQHTHPLPHTHTKEEKTHDFLVAGGAKDGDRL